MGEKVKGRMKEAAGAFTGDEGKKAEGQAQQRKASAREQQKRIQSEQNKADRAEKSRDKHRRKDKGGILGNL